MYLHENHEHANNFTFPRKLSEKIWQAGLRKNLYVFKFLPLLFIFVSQASFGIETQSVLQAQRDNEAIFINAAAKQLNKSPDVLTRTDYARIESISLPYPAILSIEPLTRFPNLKTLLLTSTYFTDTNPLSYLTKLQRLDLLALRVSNIEPLRKLSNLQRLSLIGTKVTDISPLGNLRNLQYLYIGLMPVKNIEPIGRLRNLRTLHLTGTKVIDFSPLSNLTNLEYLNLKGSQISDLRPIAKLANLKELNLTDCDKITDQKILNLKSALPQLNIKR